MKNYPNIKKQLKKLSAGDRKKFGIPISNNDIDMLPETVINSIITNMENNDSPGFKGAGGEFSGGGSSGNWDSESTDSGTDSSSSSDSGSSGSSSD